MFDIGWQELFVIAAVTIIVVGPKELPKVLRAVTAVIGKIRSVTREVQKGVDDLVREAELNDARKQIQEAGRWDIDDDIMKAIEDDGITPELDEIKDSLEAAAKSTKTPTPAPATSTGTGTAAAETSPAPSPPPAPQSDKSE